MITKMFCKFVKINCMFKKLSIVCGLCCWLLVAVAQNQLVGFNPNAVKKQLEIEKKFDSFLSSQRIGETIKLLSSVPHHTGSEGGKFVAEKVKQKFIEYGWDAEIKSYKVLFPTPVERVLEMTSPVKFVASLKEKSLKEDATSGQEGQLPTYNCWSADGDVTAGLIFVNYGLPSDYEILKQYGIDVKGKIVIAKYGRSWRGIKPKVAQEHGAIGCIIYSDPIDDGYVPGDVYPKGAYKNETGVQRGSVMDMVIYPGDPLTPNIGATENAKRLDRSEVTNLLKIPVLPISYGDALPLLEQLSGEVVPRDWVGGLPITYHFGDGNTQVHLKLKFNWQMTYANNVIATIKGNLFPNQWIIRGNHHDAWVNGAEDPISSLAVELDEAYAIGKLMKLGWKPKRTLVYCAWDAEEPGLMGSTEWVEDNADILNKNAVVYINSDGNGRGFVNIDGSQAFENMITQILKNVTDPQTNISVFDRDRLKNLSATKSLEEGRKIIDNPFYKIDAVGSGSDYSPFIQHLGIPALNIGFGGEDGGGEYHSIFDSYDLYARFKDINFIYGPALAKVTGRTILRISESEVLPFNYKNTAKTILTYIKEVEDLANQIRFKHQLENLKINENSQALSADPQKKLVFNKTLYKPDQYLNFSPLMKAIAALNLAVEKIELTPEKLTASEQQHLNMKLYQAEKKLLSKEGLPRRSWYKHTIYAPGFYTGYGVKTLPGIREAIEQNDYTEAQQQIFEAAAAISNLAKFLEE